jgi:hypothetical protein
VHVKRCSIIDNYWLDCQVDSKAIYGMETQFALKRHAEATRAASKTGEAN